MNLLIGVATLAFTALGSIVAILGIRQSRRPKPLQIYGTVDPNPAFTLLGTRQPLSRDEVAAARVLSRFVFVNHNGPTTTGSLGQFDFTLFLDLFSACTYPKYCKRLATLAASYIKRIRLQERPTYLAVPKEGNVLLAAEIARQLRVGLIIVRAIVPPIRFGDPVEGMFPAGASVAVVDDIACDGELLARTVAALRAHGARVTQCFCVVERMDGNSRARLAQHNVRLHAPIQLDEHTLRELADLPGPAVDSRPIMPTES
jgi:orotate phosphoribosyltransferase